MAVSANLSSTVLQYPAPLPVRQGSLFCKNQFLFSGTGTAPTIGAFVYTTDNETITLLDLTAGAVPAGGIVGIVQDVTRASGGAIGQDLYQVLTHAFKTEQAYVGAQNAKNSTTATLGAYITAMGGVSTLDSNVLVAAF